MVERSSPNGETIRLQALHSLKILDTQPEARFDRITRMAKRLFDVPVAVLSLTDQHRQNAAQRGDWLEAFESVGAPAGRGPGMAGAKTKAKADEILVVADVRADPRLDSLPRSVEGIEVRFYAGYPILAPDGSRLGTLSLMDSVPRTLSSEDVELLNELGAMVTEELRSLSMATSDELTKLANRRGFECIASHILPIAKRLRVALSLVQIDLDGFKQINDTRGHEAGDRLLVVFAKHLLKNFRQSDVVARLGGDEFCVLMSGTDQAQVRESLQRLRQRLQSVGGDAIGFSAGIATFNPLRHRAIADLLREADRRMYEMKRRKQDAAGAAELTSSLGSA